MKKIMIPIGEENFEKIRTRGFYYIDKTRLIRELVDDSFTVNLITRPRRFGKTLAMSMLKNFFDIRKDSRKLFEGLEISRHEETCKEWMNQYPVLFLSFKDIANRKYTDACDQLAFNLSSLCIEHKYLKDSDKVDKVDRNCFEHLMERTATRTEVDNSLFILTRMLYMHYGRPVMLLIDEYDVPLAKASEYGYYEEMLDRIRAIMSTVFKTNDFLQFAVVTGCLRLAKESIFTGTNHFKANSVAGKRYLDCFGFTTAETDCILKDTGCSDKASAMQSWYDGYHFGAYDIYCPWDVLNYVSDLMEDPKTAPESYWKDTSHNDIIRKFIGRDDIDISEQLEMLLSGCPVRVKIKEDTNYNFAQATEDDLWSILYFTGYLTTVRSENQRQELKDEKIWLTIPNEEIKTIFGETIVEWFKEDIAEKAQEREELFTAWWSGDVQTVTEILSDILNDTISYFDYKEDYYHAFLAGLFSGAGYMVTSNDENGRGRTDVVVKDRKKKRLILIEIKHSVRESEMKKDCEKALGQIEQQQYARRYLKSYSAILCYGVAFYAKDCMIQKSEPEKLYGSKTGGSGQAGASGSERYLSGGKGGQCRLKK